VVSADSQRRIERDRAGEIVSTAGSVPHPAHHGAFAMLFLNLVDGDFQCWSFASFSSAMKKPPC